MGHSRPLFSLFLSFQYTVDSKQMLNKFADDWIRTADLWYRKRPFYQLSHTTTAHSDLFLCHDIEKCNNSYLWNEGLQKVIWPSRWKERRPRMDFGIKHVSVPFLNNLSRSWIMELLRKYQNNVTWWTITNTLFDNWAISLFY